MELADKIYFLRKSIKDVAAKFEPVYLHELPPENQMTRFDFKYIFSSNHIAELIKPLRNDYSVLEIEQRRLMAYQSDYFETPGDDMYLDHHNGKTNRFKIRIRKYLDTDDSFLEIKRKNNKGLMIKRRVELDEENRINGEAKRMISKLTPYDPSDLERSLTSRFSRITLQNNCMQERVTIDCCLQLMRGGKNISLPGLGIMEVKKCDIHSRTHIDEVLHEERILPTNFSKYCTGMALLKEGIKYNNFKEKLLTINKFEYEFDLNTYSIV